MPPSLIAIISHINRRPQCLLLFVDQSWDLLFGLDSLRIFLVHLDLSIIDLTSYNSTSHFPFYLVERCHCQILTNVGHTQQ